MRDKIGVGFVCFRFKLKTNIFCKNGQPRSHQTPWVPEFEGSNVKIFYHEYVGNSFPTTAMQNDVLFNQNRFQSS